MGGIITGAAAASQSLLFSALYELICIDQGITPTGTAVHNQQIFESLDDSHAFKKKGSKVFFRRWFSWVDACAFKDTVWHSTVLSLIMFAMSCGIYKNFSEVPL